MDLGLKGKVALVVAASQGLGRAVAEELAAEGASLVLCARGERALLDTCAEIGKKYGAQVVGVPAGQQIVDAALAPVIWPSVQGSKLQSTAVIGIRPLGQPHVPSLWSDVPLERALPLQTQAPEESV